MNRSGTTLLRMMLDAHRELTIPPETHFVPDLIKAAREDDATPESALEAMKSAREWGDFGFSDEEMLARLRALDEAQAGARRARPSTTPTPSSRASRAGARRRRPTCRR